MEVFKGVYYSSEWLRKNILRQSEEEVKEIDNQINAEPDPDDVARVPLGPPEPEPEAPAAPTNGTSNNNSSNNNNGS